MADQIIDCSGLACPMPIVKTNKGIKAVEIGQSIEVIATDPAFEADIKAWANKTGNTLVEIKKAGDKTSAILKRNA